MDAVISGRAGVGILLGSELQCLSDPGEIKSIPLSAIPLLVGGYPDLTVLEDVDLNQIRTTLSVEVACDDSLHLALILLDPATTQDIRRDAAGALDELLQTHHVSRSLESILYARPLPADADASGALDICEELEARATGKLLSDLRENQANVMKAYTSWAAIPPDIFSSASSRASFEITAIAQGFFRDFSVAIASSHVGDFVISALSNPNLKEFRERREVLLRWTEPFRKIESPNLGDLTDDSWDDMNSGEPDKPRHIPRREAKAAVARVKLQKEAIKNALREKDVVRATQYIADLKADQIKHGGSRFLVKSLCDIAMDAKRFGYYDLQLELTAQAVEVEPGDAWAWCQHGDALLIKSRLREARDAFKQAGALGDATVGKVGQAQVAKLDGRLLDALAAYDALIADFPRDVMARSGRAEVLKSLNRLDEALGAYDANITAHPGDAVARNGRAGVLKSLNRLDEALAAYEDTINDHPENVVSKNGRAEMLKSLNRLDEALAAYNAILNDYPESVVARGGRAEVLKSLNRLDEALAAYNAIIKDYPESVIAKSGRAEVLKSLNRLDEALNAYDASIAAHPEDVVAKCGRAEVLKSLNRLDEALAAYDAIIADFPQDQYAKAGRASTLVLLGQYEEVLSDSVDLKPVTPSEWIRYHIRGIALILVERFDEAISIFEHGANNDPRPTSRAYFRTALAVGRIRLCDYNRAIQVLQTIDAPRLHVPVTILRIHAHGELGHRAEAMAAYVALGKVSRQHNLGHVVSELHDRYLNGHAPRHSHEWLVSQEARMLLVA